jgi:hypothetical protein
MSTATDLLLIAKNNGLLLSLEGENLRVRWQGVPPSQDLLASIKTHKPQLISLLATNDHYLKNVVMPVIQEIEPQSLVAQIEPLNEVQPTWSMDRYAHMVKCQQCEHFSFNGECQRKIGLKPLPEAMRECEKFVLLKSEREPVQEQPYTATELDTLLAKYEKPLFYHLLDCVACSFMESRYCVEAFAIGSSYDALLLVFDDAASKREALLNTVIRARLSGRSVFGGAKCV